MISVLHVGTFFDPRDGSLCMRGIRLCNHQRVTVHLAAVDANLRALVLEVPSTVSHQATSEFVASMNETHQADARVRDSLVRITPTPDDAQGGAWRATRCVFVYFARPADVQTIARRAINQLGCHELRRDIDDDSARLAFMRDAGCRPYQAWPCARDASQQDRYHRIGGASDRVSGEDLSAILRVWLLFSLFDDAGELQDVRAVCASTRKERHCVREHARFESRRCFQKRVFACMVATETVDCFVCGTTDETRMARLVGANVSLLAASATAAGYVYLRCDDDDLTGVDTASVCVELFARGLSMYPVGTRDELLYKKKTRLFTHNAALRMVSATAGEDWVVLPAEAQLKRARDSVDTAPVTKSIGGCHLRPTIGVHSVRVTVFDFASFYPSCIAKFNIGPDTVRPRDDDADHKSPCERSVWLPMYHIGEEHATFCDCCHAATFTACSRTLRVIHNGDRSVRVWVNTRPDEASSVCITARAERQTPLATVARTLVRARDACTDAGDHAGAAVCKLLANSCFGMLNQRGPRNFLRSAAAYRAVVLQGRTYLLSGLCALHRKGMTALYGVTDSLFVYGSDTQPGLLAERLTRELDALHAQPRLA
ncbi:hypothetical protein CYMTET_40672 [Cymbomonas tetramitiformis]|uniref:DNA-directed DNA polymerase n=1 Tax=Cymbomonas tetramitiformis TaxID=36881 RepID=A0AAE0F3B0_9CHLO|nr:hypothetical protein CYMTET_40672 [Cymbomonas tetramitiformis]